MISTENVETAKALIKKEKSPIIVLAKNDDFNRKMLEYGKFSILLSPEIGKRKDKPKQLDSGLNQVLAKIASKNKVSIGIDLHDIQTLDKKEKAVRIARIKQNVEICRKANAHIKLLNYKDKKDAFAFLTSLGASTKQASAAL